MRCIGRPARRSPHPLPPHPAPASPLIIRAAPSGRFRELEQQETFPAGRLSDHAFCRPMNTSCFTSETSDAPSWFLLCASATRAGEPAPKAHPAENSLRIKQGRDSRALTSYRGPDSPRVNTFDGCIHGGGEWRVFDRPFIIERRQPGPRSCWRHTTDAR